MEFSFQGESFKNYYAKNTLIFHIVYFCRYIIPRTLVLTSMISCIVAAIILCIWGQTHAGLFLGTGLLGLGVAVQFPRYWVSQQVLDRYLSSKKRQIEIANFYGFFKFYFSFNFFAVGYHGQLNE